MDDDALQHELLGRARRAGEACGLYEVWSGAMVDLDGEPARPMTVVMRFGVGDLAWRPAASADAEATAATLRAMEEEMGRADVEQLRRRAAEGPLGELERGGA